MKRKLSLILSIAFIFCIFANISVSAAPLADYNSKIEYFEDGSYIVTTVETDGGISAFSSEKQGIKTATYYTNDGTARCALRLTAGFAYNGSTVSCVSAAYVTYVYDTAWKVEDVSTSRSGASTTKASATASGTAVKRFLGIKTNTAPISVTLYCDKNGNLS